MIAPVAVAPAGKGKSYGVARIAPHLTQHNSLPLQEQRLPSPPVRSSFTFALTATAPETTPCIDTSLPLPLLCSRREPRAHPQKHAATQTKETLRSKRLRGN